MKLKRNMVVLTGISALLLTACGGDSGETSSTDSDSADTTAAAPADADSTEAPVRDQNADLVIWTDNLRAPIIEEYATTFGEENGIAIQVQVATDVRQQFKDATNVDQGPDVIVGAHDWLGEFVQNGIVEPIQMSSDVEAGFTEQSLEATKFNGQIYGVPYATENLGLIRNTDLAPEEPATMEDLVADGKSLVESGETEEVMVQAVSQAGDAYNAYPYLSAYGGGFFGQKDDGSWDPENVLIDSPETIQGGEKIAYLAEEGALNVSVDPTTAEALFTAGDSPYFVTGPWSVPAVKSAGINYEISPIPEFEDGGDPTPFLGVQMFYVSSAAKNQVLAQEFVLKYVPSVDMQVALYEAGERPPALTEALDQVSADDADIEAWAAAGEGSQSLPNIPAMNAVWEPMGLAEVDIINGDDVAERLAAAQEEIVANIGR